MSRAAGTLREDWHAAGYSVHSYANEEEGTEQALCVTGCSDTHFYRRGGGYKWVFVDLMARKPSRSFQAQGDNQT